MLASFPASMVNQKQTDLGIPNRFNLTPSRFSSPGMLAQIVKTTYVGNRTYRMTLGLIIDLFLGRYR